MQGMASDPPPEPGRGPQAKKPARARDRKIRKGVRNVHLAALGWNFVTAPLVGGGIGYVIDHYAGTYPWAMVIGLFLGFVSAFIDLIRGVR